MKSINQKNINSFLKKNINQEYLYKLEKNEFNKNILLKFLNKNKKFQYFQTTLFYLNNNYLLTDLEKKIFQYELNQQGLEKLNIFLYDKDAIKYYFKNDFIPDNHNFSTEYIIKLSKNKKLINNNSNLKYYIFKKIKNLNLEDFKKINVVLTIFDFSFLEEIPFWENKDFKNYFKSKWIYKIKKEKNSNIHYFKKYKFNKLNNSDISFLNTILKNEKNKNYTYEYIKKYINFDLLTPLNCFLKYNFNDLSKIELNKDNIKKIQNNIFKKFLHKIKNGQKNLFSLINDYNFQNLEQFKLIIDVKIIKKLINQDISLNHLNDFIEGLDLNNEKIKIFKYLNNEVNNIIQKTNNINLLMSQMLSNQINENDLLFYSKTFFNKNNENKIIKFLDNKNYIYLDYKIEKKLEFIFLNKQNKTKQNIVLSLIKNTYYKKDTQILKKIYKKLNFNFAQNIIYPEFIHIVLKNKDLFIKKEYIKNYTDLNFNLLKEYLNTNNTQYLKNLKLFLNKNINCKNIIEINETDDSILDFLDFLYNSFKTIDNDISIPYYEMLKMFNFKNNLEEKIKNKIIQYDSIYLINKVVSNYDNNSNIYRIDLSKNNHININEKDFFIIYNNFIDNFKNDYWLSIDQIPLLYSMLSNNKNCFNTLKEISIKNNSFLYISLFTKNSLSNYQKTLLNEEKNINEILEKNLDIKFIKKILLSNQKQKNYSFYYESVYDFFNAIKDIKNENIQKKIYNIIVKNKSFSKILIQDIDNIDTQEILLNYYFKNINKNKIFINIFLNSDLISYKEVLTYNDLIFENFTNKIINKIIQQNNINLAKDIMFLCKEEYKKQKYAINNNFNIIINKIYLNENLLKKLNYYIDKYYCTITIENTDTKLIKSVNKI